MASETKDKFGGISSWVVLLEAVIFRYYTAILPIFGPFGSNLIVYFCVMLKDLICEVQILRLIGQWLQHNSPCDATKSN